MRANGYVGYTPTEEAFGPHGGGYETRLDSDFERIPGLRVAEELCEPVVLRVAARAEHLHGAVCDFREQFRRGGFADEMDFLEERFPGVEPRGDGAHERFDGGDGARKQWIGIASWAGTIVVVARAQSRRAKASASIALAVLFHHAEAVRSGGRGR